jgi:hypothetical protein
MPGVYRMRRFPLDILDRMSRMLLDILSSAGGHYEALAGVPREDIPLDILEGGPEARPAGLMARPGARGSR